MFQVRLNALVIDKVYIVSMLMEMKTIRRRFTIHTRSYPNFATTQPGPFGEFFK